ncbi:unnamed protein product [Choristocarpus tenellus]
MAPLTLALVTTVLALIAHCDAFIPPSSVTHWCQARYGARTGWLGRSGTGGAVLAETSEPETTASEVMSERRDPKEWFDWVRGQAPPRPEALAELSSAAEKKLEEIPLPNRKQEPFRYTELEKMFRTNFVAGGAGSLATGEAVSEFRSADSAGQQLVFVNGILNKELSDTSGLVGIEGLVATHLGGVSAEHMPQVQELLAHLPEVDADHRTRQGALPFASLNQACFSDVAVIMVEPGVEVEKPVQVLFVSDGSVGPSISHPRLLVSAGQGSKLRIRESFTGFGESHLTNALGRVIVHEGADVVSIRFEIYYCGGFEE